MAMSRTARILIAILLLAAAAFFWVNFYTQSRTAETPTPTDPVAAGGAAEPAASGAGDVVTEPGAVGDAEATAAAADGAGGAVDASVPADGDTAPAADTDPVAPTNAAADAETDVQAPLVVAPIDDAPPTVVVEGTVAVGREIVIADLPFLVTEPRPVDDVATEAADVEGELVRGVTTPTRATVNPFSPVVVRTPPAPERDVPATSPVVGEVAVPAGPTPAEVAAAAAATRASAPTPRAVTPGSPSDTSSLRPLPTGSVLSSTPDLLREPRVGSVAEEVDFATVTAIAVPEAEPATLEPSEAAPAQADAPDQVEPLTSTSGQPATATDPQTRVIANDPPPLLAGATQLARFLRDQNFAFTGSVVGPIGVAVFRSDLDPAPVVVALGQTLPETEIVLTDLRGQQAELRLGDTTQILTLDLRR